MENSQALSTQKFWPELVAAEPLSAFSWYLAGRKNVLLEVAGEVLDNLDKGINDSYINMEFVGRAEALMWLWILGAYEVTRTMYQASSSFDKRVHESLQDLKVKLADVRVPAAKMEKRGKKEPVTSNRSPSGIDSDQKDLLIGDPDGPIYSARALLCDFKQFFESLTPSDVIRTHEATFEASD